MDNRYFLFVNDQQLGPFTLEELKSKHISTDTFVWFEGLDDWTEARKIDALKPLFFASPPPFRSVKKSKAPQRIFGLKKLQVYIVIGSVLCLLLFFSVKSSFDRQQHQLLLKTDKIDQLTQQNNNQQVMIEELQTKLDASIHQSSDLFDADIKENINDKRQQIQLKLIAAQSNLSAAQKELEDAESFQLFRMSWEKEEDIQTALDNVNYYSNQVSQLQQKLKELSNTGY